MHPFALDPVTEVDFCESCKGIWLRRALPSVRTLEREQDLLRVPFHHWKIHLWALPIALAIALLARTLSLTRALSHFWLEMPVHEFGHAIAGWLGGRAMIPIPLLTIGLNDERSGLVFLLLAGALVYLGTKALQERRGFPVVICVVTLLAAFYCTWIASDMRSRMLLVYGGVAGTFLISTFFVVSFYYRLPEKLRWDFFRFLPLLIGTNVLVLQLSQWRAIAAGRELLPRGSAIVGRDDPNGDINRLLGEFGWSEPEIIAHFLRLGTICSLVILGHYLFFLWKARLTRA